MPEVHEVTLESSRPALGITFLEGDSPECQQELLFEPSEASAPAVQPPDYRSLDDQPLPTAGRS
jgi:hypothetical protein